MKGAALARVGGALVFALLIGLLAPPGAGAALYPPDGPLQPAPPTSRTPLPPYLEAQPDPALGTVVRRISDPRVFHQPGARWIRHAYAKNQPWNADGSLLMLDYTYPAPLLDGDSYRLLGSVHQPSQALWSPTDPDLLIGTRDNELVAWNARDDERAAVLGRFPGYEQISLGAGEGNLSNTGRWAALLGVRRGGGVDVLVYDIAERDVVGRRSYPRLDLSDGRSGINNATMSQSGDYAIVEFNRRGRTKRRGIVAFNRSMGDPQPLSANGGSHYDACVETDGDESIVTRADHSSALVSSRLADAEATRLLPERLLNYSIHISCRNTARPGWTYVSEFYDPTSTGRANTNLVIAVRLDGSRTVERFAREHRSKRRDYAREPHAVPSRDGSRVLFASDWMHPHGPVLAYVAEASTPTARLGRR
jgi:hypothetical protein